MDYNTETWHMTHSSLICSVPAQWLVILDTLIYIAFNSYETEINFGKSTMLGSFCSEESGWDRSTDTVKRDHAIGVTSYRALGHVPPTPSTSNCLIFGHFRATQTLSLWHVVAYSQKKYTGL